MNGRPASPRLRPPGPAGVFAPLPLPGAAQLLTSRASPPAIRLYLSRFICRDEEDPSREVCR